MGEQKEFPFVSASLPEHLLRGLLAFGSLFLSVFVFRYGTWYAFAGGAVLIVSAFLMFRGCPVCWTIGLFGTCKINLSKEKLRTNK